MLLLLGLKGSPLILLIYASSLHLGAFKKKSLLHVIVVSLYQFFFHVMIKLVAKEDLFPQFIRAIGSLNAELGGLGMWPRDPFLKVIAETHAKYL